MTEIPLEPRIEAVDIEEEVKRSYLDYAMSVIVGRALPDVRDGLKPVHRRILHSMNGLRVLPNTPFKKSARVVGECFVKGALVHTPTGLRPIEDIEIGEHVLDPHGVPRPVVMNFVNPPSSVVRVEFVGGHSIVVTPGQLFQALNDDLTVEWVTADRLQGRRVIGVGAPSVSVARADESNELYSYVLGLAVAEGCPAHRSRNADGRVRIGMCDREPLEAAAAWAIEADINATFAKRAAAKPTWRDQHILTFARHEGLLDATTPRSEHKRVPAAVLADRRLWLPFLAGFLDGDGYVRKGRREIVLVTTSDVLRRQLHAMATDLGFRPHHWNREATNAKHHRLLGLAFTSSSAIALAHSVMRYVRIPAKQEALAQLLDRGISSWRERWDRVPMATIAAEHSAAHLGAGWYRASDGTKFRSRLDPAGSPEVRYGKDALGRAFQERAVSLERMRTDGWIEKLERIGSPLAERLTALSNMAVLRVSGVVRLDEKMATYDIQVDSDEHAFVVEGIAVHNCMGKFHPHGDQAIYDALVRMAQDFAMRAPLIQGHGNFGSVDGDPPAAQRYTECRLALLAMEMLRGIDEETVDFIPNYDGEETEPVVLPARYPNLLVNGSTGIAVGMATNIPPHNLTEVVDATIHLIDNPDATVDDLMKFVKGPDFPTGGIIMGRQGLRDALTTGRGSVKVRGKATIEESASGKQRIIVTELPYMVSGDRVLAKIAEMVEKKVITGIATTRDSLKNESNRQGLRLVITLKRDAIPQVVLNNIYKYTQLQDSFGVNMLALVDGVPRTLSLPDVLKAYISHQVQVIERRTSHRLRVAEEESHILEGYLIAFNNLDDVIALIRASASGAAAKEALMSRFSLSEIQANKILELPLRRLASLERQQIIDRHAELQTMIADYKDILANPERVRTIIKEEMGEIREKFGNKRRSSIQADEGEIDIEDLIADEDVVVTLTRSGYIKRVVSDVYRTQGRGGKGVRGAKPKEGDIVEHLLTTNAHAYVLFFSTRGKVYRIKAHEIPEKDRTARGISIRNLLPLAGDDSIAAVIDTRDYGTHKYLVMATKKGVIKKTEFRAYDSSRRDGIIAIKLREGDELVHVNATSGEDELVLATRKGQSIVFAESEVRAMGRDASGVQGIRVKPDDEVMAFAVVDPNGELLLITDAGYGKRTLLTSYPRQHRGGSGVKTAQLTSRKGFVAGAMVVRPGHEVFLISSAGQVIRIPCKDVRRTGRDAQGVRVMRMQPGEVLSAMAPVIADEDEA